jgi:small subunit ribosomal protein S13
LARLAGVDLPLNKKLEIGLTYIFGIGKKTALDILEICGIDPLMRVKDLTDGQIAALRKEIEDNRSVEGDLRTEIAMNIKRLKDIKCYRGMRHMRRLPVRGQRTKTNARTRKGKVKTMPNKKK